MSWTYEHPRPAVTVDAVVFGLVEGELNLLLIERDVEPFAGRWALPGGFVEPDEPLERAARRELEEETGLALSYLEQLYTFGDPGRDPRGHVITVAWFALVRPEDCRLEASTDARSVRWFPHRGLPPLAFDHERIIDVAIERLRSKIRYRPVGFELLPERFTLSQIQAVYEGLLERPLDKRNFRKKLLKMDLLQALDTTQQGVAHRAARLYRFDRDRYARLTAAGFDFDL